jgi:hypothetical protein
VGVEPRRAVSPDGRVWHVKRLRERLSLADTANEPFFWTSLLITLVMLAVIARLVIVDPVAPMMLFFVLPLMAIWVLERGAYLLRPRIEATTNGPPPERILWKTSRRFGYGRLERKVLDAIERGQPGSEPSGLTLVEVEAGRGVRVPE